MSRPEKRLIKRWSRFGWSIETEKASVDDVGVYIIVIWTVVWYLIGRRHA